MTRENEKNIQEEKMVDETGTMTPRERANRAALAAVQQTGKAFIDDNGEPKYPSRSRALWDSIQEIRQAALEEAKTYSEDDIRAMPLPVITDLLHRMNYGDSPLSDEEAADLEKSVNIRMHLAMEPEFKRVEAEQEVE
jgi:hypothetical protein